MFITKPRPNLLVPPTARLIRVDMHLVRKALTQFCYCLPSLSGFCVPLYWWLYCLHIACHVLGTLNKHQTGIIGYFFSDFALAAQYKRCCRMSLTLIVFVTPFSLSMKWIHLVGKQVTA